MTMCTMPELQRGRFIPLFYAALCFFGGYLFATLQGQQQYHDFKEAYLRNSVKLFSKGTRTRLADLPNGIFSLMDASDEDLKEVYAINLAFLSDLDDVDADFEGDGFEEDKLRFVLDGYERFSIAPEEDGRAFEMETLNLYLRSKDYHSLQLLHTHDSLTGKDSYSLSLHNDNTTHEMLNAGRYEHRRRQLGRCSDCKRKKGNFIKKCIQCATQALDLEKRVNGYISDIEKLGDELMEAVEFIENLPKQIEDKILDPIVEELNKAANDIGKIDDIAENLARQTINELKDTVKFLPDASDLAQLLEDGMKDFMGSDFCIPYDCMAGKLGIDISDIDLYTSQRMSLKTEIDPKSCVSIEKIEFDVNALKDLLDLFTDLSALDEIFDEVEDYISGQMNQILAFTDDIESTLDDIRDVVDDALDLLGLPNSRRSSSGTTQMSEEDLQKLQQTINANIKDMTQGFKKFGNFGRRRLADESMSIEKAVAIGYEKGRSLLEQRYGEHIERVFQERRLKDNAKDYIVLKTLDLKFTASFGQTFTLTASDRTGFADSLLDEALHQSTIIPVPLTGGMVRLVVSGSLEAKMPYAMMVEGSAEASFTYFAGTEVNIDVIKGKVNSDETLETNFIVDGSVGVSGYMAMNFAASTSLALCLGPSTDTCLTLTVDAKQGSAAGFDGLAHFGISSDNSVETPALLPFYTDLLEYKNVNNCEGDLTLQAGYWQYVLEPSVEVSLTGDTFCGPTTLYTYEGEILQSSTDNWCTAVDI